MMFWTGFTFALGAIVACLITTAALVAAFACTEIWFHKKRKEDNDNAKYS